ncbi:MAG: HAD family hydrolase [Hansschlegelia sp.]
MNTSNSAILGAAAVIFDVDGTLVDSVDFHAEAWRRTFAAFGKDVDQDEIRSQIGKGGDQLMPVFLEPEQLEREGKAIEEFRSALFKSDYLERVRGFPDARELFEELLARGAVVALGSSAKGAELEAYKKAAGIGDLRLVEATSEDVENTKPHPDIFQAALAKTRASPGRAVVVGDSPFDAEAAVRAGVIAVGVLCGGFDETDLRSAGMSEIYEDPSDLLRMIRAA